MAFFAFLILIWETSFYRIIIDLLMIAGFITAAYFIPRQKILFSQSKTRQGFLLLIPGLGFLMVFFIFDLISLVLLPQFFPPEGIPAFIEEVFKIFVWVIFPLGLGLTLTGFILIIRRYFEAVHSLAESQTKLSDELKHRKKIEKSLLDAQRVGKMGNWDWNIQTGELWWSDQIYSIFGRKKGKFQSTYEAFLDTVHPDDREKVKAAVDNAVEKNTPTTSSTGSFFLPGKSGGSRNEGKLPMAKKENPGECLAPSRI